MLITQADPEFRPITVVIETQDEYDQLIAILSAVAGNRVNHLPQVVKAAGNWCRLITAVIEGE